MSRIYRGGDAFYSRRTPGAATAARRAWPIMGLSLVAGVVVALAGVSCRPHENRRSHVLQVMQARLAPSAHRIAFVTTQIREDGRETSTVHVADLSTGECAVVSHGFLLDWFPDSTGLLVTNGRGSFSKIDLSSTPPGENKVAWLPRRTWTAVFSHSGGTVACTGPGTGRSFSLWAIDPRTGVRRQLANWSFIRPHDLAWSRSDAFIYFCGYPLKGASREIARVRMSDGQVQVLSDGVVPVLCRETGMVLFEKWKTDLPSELWVMDPNKPTTAKRVAVPLVIRTPYYDYECADGSLLILDGAHTLWHVKRNGQSAKRLARKAYQPNWESRGDRVTYFTYSGNDLVLWEMEISSGSKRAVCRVSPTRE